MNACCRLKGFGLVHGIMVEFSKPPRVEYQWIHSRRSEKLRHSSSKEVAINKFFGMAQVELQPGDLPLPPVSLQRPSNGNWQKKKGQKKLLLTPAVTSSEVRHLLRGRTLKPQPCRERLTLQSISEARNINRRGRRAEEGSRSTRQEHKHTKKRTPAHEHGISIS